MVAGSRRRAGGQSADCSSQHATSSLLRLASVRTASATLTLHFRRGNLNTFEIYCLLFGAAMIIYNACRPPGQSGAGQASAAQSQATSAVAITRSGRSRTSSSPGTAFRRPNSSARSAPMYRPAIAVAKCSSSSRSSLSVT